MVKNLQYLYAFILLASLAAPLTAFRKSTGSHIRTIVIDPGHGGKDPGCQGVSHREKDIALSVALRLGKYLEQNLKGVRVIYTRTTDVFVELEDRAQIANRAKADLFISIHCNAAGKPVIITDPKTGKKRVKTYKNKRGRLVPVETANPVPFGSETYVMGLKNEEGKMKVATRENSAMLLEDNYESKYSGFDPESEESYIIMSNYTSAFVIQSASLAMKIQEEYAKKAGRIDKGVHRQSIWVLWRTSMPSILTELGYLTNPLEESFLGSETGQDYLAKCLFRAIRRYKDEFEGVKQVYNDEFENQPPLANENTSAGNAPVTKKAEEEADAETKRLQEQQEVVIAPTGAPTSKAETIDTAVTAKKIADTYRVEKKQPSPVAPKEQPLAMESTGGSVFYKVQFASSDVALNLGDERFAVVKDADFYKAGNILKYTSGKFTSMRDAQSHQGFLRSKGFKDCFIIALKNGERIDLREARQLLAQ